MSSVARVAIDASQFPEPVRQDLLESLRARRLNHKFLYEGVRQAQKWLALHEAYAPSRTDPDCAAIYERAFAAAIARLSGPNLHLIGLGCGGGQKEARLLGLLREAGSKPSYFPVDVSAEMVLTARQAAVPVLGDENCFPLVLDLAKAEDLPSLLDEISRPSRPRLVTLFGVLPNLEPELILPPLRRLLRPGDGLLMSANLAPGTDYRQAVEGILPQYDNELTRDWLMGFLLDLGIERNDGHIRFIIEERPAGRGLNRIAAYFDFGRARQIQVYGERFAFQPGESVRLFFSYRYMPALLRELLAAHGLNIVEQWISQSGEEGVFLVG